MGRKLVYVLNAIGNLGCIPEPALIEVDDKGKPGTFYIILSEGKHKSYKHFFCENDNKLIGFCNKLEKKSIISFVRDYDARNWDAFYAKYFNPQEKSQKVLAVREQIYSYINRNLNGFFSELKSEQLFLIAGKFPFSWKEVKFQSELADLFYCFNYNGCEILYTTQIEFHNTNLNITGAVLVSRKPARIMLNNRIYEFPDDIEGNKLIPFFRNQEVVIPAANIDQYISSVIMPLVLTNKVIPNGFTIDVFNKITDVVLSIKETGGSGQLSLFASDDMPAHGSMELIFYYSDFSFPAGRIGRVLKLEKSDKNFAIRQVVRNEDDEEYYSDQIKKTGIDLYGRIVNMPLSQCVEYLTAYKEALESLGITVDYENKELKKEILFTGVRNIKIELYEEKDWFDVKATAYFGEFKIAFVKILELMRRNKFQFVLPDGQIAQIPQSWFNEYRSFLDVCIVKDDSVRLSHYHVSAIAELENFGMLKAGLKDRFRKLLEQEAPSDYELPQNFGAELRPYQIVGYRWLRLLDELNLGACLADDMGLGKTIQTLTLLLWLKEQNRRLNLLVVPTSLVFNWMNEISKFCPSLKVYIHTGSDRMREGKFNASFDIIITSYAILRRDKEMFADNNFGYVILDEAQAIKNAGADIFKAVVSLRAQRFLTLTGTPLENSYADLWSQMHFVNRGILGSLKDFNSRMQESDFQSRVAMLIKPFILRRTKAQVLTDLPEKQVFTEFCEMGDEQYTFYKELRNTIRERFLGDREAKEKLNAIIVLEGLLRLRQASNHPVLVDKEYSGFSGKFDSVITKLHEILEQNAKVLIFSSFVEHLSIYRRHLIENNINYSYIDGSTKDREAEVMRFQNDESTKVFILSLKAGGTGLNLTAASYVFLLDPWWNPAAEAQAADRAHRIGQKNAVFVYRFISAGSIEEKILNLQKNKLEMFDKMIGETPEDFQITNADDVLSLLE